jgi:hypothetical protein
MIPHLYEKTSAKYMFVDMTNIFQRNNENKKMTWRENLKDTKMTRSDIVTSYSPRLLRFFISWKQLGRS